MNELKPNQLFILGKNKVCQCTLENYDNIEFHLAMFIYSKYT